VNSVDASASLPKDTLIFGLTIARVPVACQRRRAV
jgi:hypothetical protein